MAETGMNWYVLRAVSGKEAKLKEYIEAEIKHNDLLSANVAQSQCQEQIHMTCLLWKQPLRSGKKQAER